jgi:hypothetical protein
MSKEAKGNRKKKQICFLIERPHNRHLSRLINTYELLWSMVHSAPTHIAQSNHLKSIFNQLLRLDAVVFHHKIVT